MRAGRKLAVLTPREKELLLSRFGLDENHARTADGTRQTSLDELRERIDEIEQRALLTRPWAKSQPKQD